MTASRTLVWRSQGLLRERTFATFECGHSAAILPQSPDATRERVLRQSLISRRRQRTSVSKVDRSFDQNIATDVFASAAAVHRPATNVGLQSIDVIEEVPLQRQPCSDCKHSRSGREFTLSAMREPSNRVG